MWAQAYALELERAELLDAQLKTGLDRQGPSVGGQGRGEPFQLQGGCWLFKQGQRLTCSRDAKVEQFQGVLQLNMFRNVKGNVCWVTFESGFLPFRG